ncbi:MAG: FAD-dependent oxidoreductase [Elusimicrobia bacterium]|nr:FAD-dependent oxidoreductase [Elusimicrobiota bacterium]
MKKFDVTIVGGGILGTCLSYWISLLFEGDVAVLEQEKDVAVHTSGRNTGVIHRPFYLHPEKRKIFARSAQISYGLWKKYAEIKNLPWKEVGTIEVATHKEDSPVLERYRQWALQNGMKDEEVAVLTSQEVKQLEPEVSCVAALHSRTDCSVNFRLFTEGVKADAIQKGVHFLFNFPVTRIQTNSNSLLVYPQLGDPIETRFLVNCAGGNAVDLIHALGMGFEYTDLHFRGEYWEIGPEKAAKIRSNIYSVPRHKDLPFLDPHWIVRSDGRREIGPNAVLVAGCDAYEGFSSSLGQLVRKIFERPLENKLRLMINPDFLKLASQEWVSSISRSRMVQRVQKFVPALEAKDLIGKGVAGVRSSVIDRQGNFLKEAIEISGPMSYHILNYNSPGATGAPAYTAFLLHRLIQKGAFTHLQHRKTDPTSIWNFQEIVRELGTAPHFPTGKWGAVPNS